MVDLEEAINANPEMRCIGNSLDEYRDAIVGVSDDNNHLIYDYDLLVACFMREGMTREEAEEHIAYNVVRSLPYQGELAPIIMHALL